MDLETFIGPYYNRNACVIFQILTIICLFIIVSLVFAMIVDAYRKKLTIGLSINFINKYSKISYVSLLNEALILVELFFW